MARQQDIMVLVAASTVNTGPVKGILQFIKKIRDPSVRFHLFNFWRHNNPVPDPFAEQTLKQGIACKFIRLGRHNYPLMIADTIRAVRANNITIIQTHGFKPSFLGFCVKLLCRVPWICFMHGKTSENAKVQVYNWIDNCLQRWADVTVLVSEKQRNAIFGGHDRQRVRVLHNAVDLENPVKISPQTKPLRERIGVRPSDKVIAVVGRLSPEKGVDVFIRALRIVKQTYSGVHGVIVGEGQERTALMDLVTQLGLEKNVSFVGFTDTPGDYMVDADIVVLPSRSEGIPNVALEAMALGKTVIATAVGGTPEVVEHELSGLLVPSDQPEILAQAILRICHNPGLAESLREGARKRVRDYFSVEARCGKLVEVYRSLK